MTPHNEAKVGEIAKTVIMPGDPKRAEFIVEHFLDEYKLVNSVRGILTYTGTYKGKEVSVMASGMGMASMGIYATELFNVYGVERIIRVGTCGGLKEEVEVENLILATDAYTVSNYAYQLTGESVNVVKASESLNDKILKVAHDNDINISCATINTSDIFYGEYTNKSISDMNCDAVEMETFALLFLAKHFGREAAAILTVSDNLVTKKELSADERRTKLKKAVLLALETL